MKMKKTLVLIVAVAGLLTACRTPRDIAYMQDARPNTTFTTPDDGIIRFQPGDRLNIRLHSRDEEQMRLFNIWGGWGGGWGYGGYGYGDGYGDGYGYGGSNSSAYTVDENGDIDFPVLGHVNIAGQTRLEVEKTIKDLILERNLCTDPTITVSFTNMNFAVMGSVAVPGLKPITKDRTTIMEALSMARDLDINGKRTNVLVMRQEGDTRVPYLVDLTRANDIYSSPVYYVKQNDIIYVEPNDKVKRNSTVNGSVGYQPGFWISLVSSTAAMITSVATVFYLIKRGNP